MTLKLEHAGLSDRGYVRERNEDNWSADPDQGLYIVSDGLGGEFAGEVASKIVAEALPALLRERMAGVEGLVVPSAKKQLKAVLSELSTQVYDQTHGEPGMEGMGATVVMVMIRDGKALVAHMGDSRAYRLRRGRLKKLTKDHSIVQLLIDAGEIIPEEAATHPARGQVTRSVGMAGEPLPEVHRTEVRAGDRLMLCTDGLTGLVGDDTIRSVLGQESDPSRACERLIQAALDSGGRDNVTAVVITATGDPVKGR